MRHAVWPTNKTPDKAEIESMYKCAYYVDAGFFRAPDVVDFGLDLHRLKECGEVVMKKSIRELRKHLGELWARMTKDQKVLFLMSSAMEGMGFLELVFDDLAVFTGDVKEEKLGLDSVRNSLFAKIPKNLHLKLEKGLGKEWIKS